MFPAPPAPATPFPAVQARSQRMCGSAALASLLAGRGGERSLPEPAGLCLLRRGQAAHPIGEPASVGVWAAEREKSVLRGACTCRRSQKQLQLRPPLARMLLACPTTVVRFGTDGAVRAMLRYMSVDPSDIHTANNSVVHWDGKVWSI